MFYFKLTCLSLLIFLLLFAPVQAKEKILIDGPVPPASRTEMGDKAAQGVSNLEVVSFTGPAAIQQAENFAGLVTTVIRNSGPDPIIDEFWVGVYLSETPDESEGLLGRMGQVKIEGMSAVDTTIVFDQILGPLFTSGPDLFAVLKLDYGEVVLETVETDNIASFPLSVAEIPRYTAYYEDFQDGPAGWTVQDLTAQPGLFFSRIDYLDIYGATRGVWWCGTSDPSWSDPMGYGNNWNQRLTKTFDLPDGVPCSLSYVIQYDTEPGYDYTRVEISNNGFTTYETLANYDDTTLGEFEFFTHDISHYEGQQVQIRFRFTSDGGWSDEDGIFLTDGAFRLDEVTVSGSPTDDFEGDGGGWIPSMAPPLGGEFRLEETPYCPSGLICDQYYEETAGTFCNAWVAYDPVTLEFPASDPDDHANGQSVDIAITSPVFNIPTAGPGIHYAIRFDTFTDLPLENGVFYTWDIRDDLNSTWRNDNFVYWSGQDGWVRRTWNVTEYVTPGATSFQIRLGANDVGWSFGYYSPTHNSTPYFDNVELLVFDDPPPTTIEPEPRVCGWSSGDTDGDGVLNSSDDCEGESASFFDRDGDGCLDPVMGGRHVEYWDESAFPLVYYIHEDGAPGITDGSDLAAIQESFNTWTTIPGAEISVSYGGTVTDPNANALDQVNTITFSDPDYVFPSGVLAVGLSTSYVTPEWDGDGIRPGQIIDGDMIFNPAAQFRTDTMGTGTWIQSVGTHEAGHMLGLSHSAVQTSTMFYVLPPQNQASQLTQEDIQAMFKAYPDANSVATANHLRGTVTDGYTGEPVAGAIVYAIQTPDGNALGDTVGCDFTLPADGTYHFLGLPLGAYFIAIHPLNGSSAIGYLEPGHINQMILSSAQTVFLPEFFDLNESNHDQLNDREPLLMFPGSTVTANLITNVDQTPPTIVGTSPGQGDVGVAVNAAVLVEFSEPMDPGSFQGNFSFRPEAGGDAVQGNAALASDDHTLMFVPNDRLAFDTLYALQILGGVRDLYENPMGDPVVVTFRTEIQPPVFIDNINPPRAIAGTPVVINGVGFDEGALSNAVTFGGIDATVLDAAIDQIEVTVPAGLPYGEVVITVTNLDNETDTISFVHLEPEEVARGHEVANVDLPSIPTKVAVSPAGDFAYVAAGTGLAMIDLSDRTNPVSTFLAVEDGVDDLGASPGGGNIFAVSSRGQKLYRFHHDNLLGPSNEIGLAGTPLGIQVGPSGRRAYIAFEGGEIQVWDIHPSSSTFESQIGYFSQVDPNLLGDMAMDPSGDRLFAVNGSGKIQVFDVAAADLIDEVTVQTNPVAVTVEPAGQYAYVTDSTGYLTVVSLSTLEVVTDIHVLGELRGAAVTPTGSFVYAANYENDNLDVIDLRPNASTFRNIVTRIPTRVNPLDLSFSPDGVFAFSLVEGERKFVVSALGAGPILESASPSAGPIGAKVVLSGSGFSLTTAVTVNGHPAIIESGATDATMTIVIPPEAETGPITMLTADPGKVSNSLTFPVLVSGPPGSLRLAANLHPTGNPELEPVMTASSGGEQIAVAGANGEVHLLDIRLGSLTYHQFTTVAGAHSSAVSALDFSPDGSTLYAVSSGSEDLVMIDTGFGNSTYGQVTPTGLLTGINCDGLVVSPGGTHVLVTEAGIGEIRVVNLAGGTPSLVNIPEGQVGAMAFHPAGNYAYLAVDTAALVILNLTDPDAPVHAGSLTLPGTEIPVSLAFTPAGTECYVLTSEMGASPNRSVVPLDTTDPALPTIATTAGTFPTDISSATDKLVLSPVGDRAVVSISSNSGTELFQSPLVPWTADPQPEHQVAGQRIAVAYGSEGSTLFVADPDADQILAFDFLGTQQLVPVWGEDQTGIVGEALASPLRVRVENQYEEGSSGVPVTFTIGSGGGYFNESGDAAEYTTLIRATDAYGFAQVDWVLGPATGDQTVQVISQGVSGSPWTFSATAITDPALLPLELVSDLLAPADGAVNVSVTTAIQAVFTKPVDPATIFESTYFLYDISDAALVPVVYGYSDQDRQVSLTPAAPLDFGKNFRVTLTNSVHDLEGGELINPVEIIFSTETPPPVPDLDSVSPPSAAPLVGLVLSGTGFDPVPSNNQIRFTAEDGGNFVDSFASESATDFIRTAVPLNAPTGTVTVIAGGTSSNSMPFTVLTPTTSPADDVVGTVRTGSATKSVTVAPDGVLAYSVSPEADLLVPVDLETLSSLPAIPVGDEPWALAIHPEGSLVYVANRMSGDVSVIDTDPLSPSWHEVLEYIPVGEYPMDIVVSPIGDRVYVANSQSDFLSVIDANQSSATFNGVIGNVRTGQSSKSVTVSPDGTRIYIGTEDGFMVLGAVDFGVIANVGTGSGTKSVTVSPDGALLILLDTQGDVFIFDVTPGSDRENQVIARVPTGSGAKSVTVSPDGALLLAVMGVGDIIGVYTLDVGASVSVLAPDATGTITDLQLITYLSAGENPQFISFDPSGSGEFIVTNAGDNSISVFGFLQGPGLLTGSVYADCPEPGTPLLGVGVDAFVNGSGEMPFSLVTHENGLYQTELEPGSYTVTLVTPLGYTLEDDAEENRVLEIAPGDTTTLDWPLVCLDIVPSPRRMSFWKHQLGVAIRGHGNYEIDGPTLCSYLDLIETSFNNHRLNQVVVYEPPESGECMDKLIVTKELMNLDGDVDMLSHARQELMALLFNVASGKLGLSEVISGDGAPVSRAITYLDQLIDDGDPVNDETAMIIAKDINKGKMVSVGFIPDGLPDFSYLPVPRKFSLSQNYPNPFNPSATIRYEVARPEHVKLVIYDLAGRMVKTLVDEPQKPDRYVIVWDGTDDRGAKLASGVYFCRMVAGSFERTHKMMLLK